DDEDLLHKQPVYYRARAAILNCHSQKIINKCLKTRWMSQTIRLPPELPVLPLPQTELGPAAIQSISRHVCNVMQCRRAQRPLPNKLGSSVSRELRKSGC
ncbi:hypothetical protein ILYODFUR_038168, partial [Ilyodon furcidens]